MSNVKNEIELFKKNEISPQTEQIKFLNNTLTRGKYDVDYVINLCKMIETKCHEMRHNPQHLQFTLQESLKKLIAFLQVEKIPTSNNPVILFTCSKCKESELIFKKNLPIHKCNFCNFF